MVGGEVIGGDSDDSDGGVMVTCSGVVVTYVLVWCIMYGLVVFGEVVYVCVCVCVCACVRVCV